MSSEWPVQILGSIEDFAHWLSTTSLSNDWVYRGQADSRWNLQASLDREVPAHWSAQERLAQEAQLIEKFHDEAYRFLGNLEQECLKNRNDAVQCMTVMQHFGAPTRLLDWTRAVGTAAYFACIDECRRDGVIWYISQKAVVASVESEWERRGFIRRPDGQIDLNSGIFDPDVEKFICLVHLRIPFARAQAQRGLFTIPSRLGMAQDAQLCEQIPQGAYGRVTIPANLKGSVIDYLERLGIDAVSLQHAGADRAALSMAWERNR